MQSSQWCSPRAGSHPLCINPALTQHSLSITGKVLPAIMGFFTVLWGLGLGGRASVLETGTPTLPRPAESSLSLSISGSTTCWASPVLPVTWFEPNLKESGCLVPEGACWRGSASLSLSLREVWITLAVLPPQDSVSSFTEWTGILCLHLGLHFFIPFWLRHCGHGRAGHRAALSFSAPPPFAIRAGGSAMPIFLAC